ncbi:hypothetical protein [Bradyrhizobium sp. LTSPM299]|uniref:hypothetical protein n=1 Tax=Bradyrhizobium sp. LTSPM299 TaxID=1619233 RepID=UPI0012E2946F|nr:hypothetical protein [Bradyrhizobium sp. LTSPM299]
MSYDLTITSTSLTLAPNTPILLVPLNPARRLLLLANTGVNPVTIKFQSAPGSAVDGFCLDGASVSGGQGGSILFKDDSPAIQGCTPIDAVFAYSMLAATVSVQEGVVAGFL